jgi:hypothetical protein
MTDRTDGHETDAQPNPPGEEAQQDAAAGFREAQERWRRWVEHQRYLDEYFCEQRGFFPPRPSTAPNRRRDSS